MGGDCIRCGMRNRIKPEQLCLECILELYQLKISEYNDLQKELEVVKNRWNDYVRIHKNKFGSTILCEGCPHLAKE